MFPGCYKIPIGISESGPNSRCYQQNNTVLEINFIRLNDVSLNCVVICHALIQYTHLFLMPKTYDFHWSNAKYIYESPTSDHPSYDHTDVILMVAV